MKYKNYKPERFRDVRELVVYASTQYADQVAFKEINRTNHKILEYSYKKLEMDRTALGTKMIEMGMDGCHIALLSESRYDWVLSFLTIMSGVGVVVPLDKELPTNDLASLIRRSDTNAIICSNTFVPIVSEILNDCPDVEFVIVMDPSKEYKDFYDMRDLINQGRKLLIQGNVAYKEKAIEPDDMCEIIFTSGTTGANKGVMLSHKNVMSDLYGFMHYINVTPVSFSVLPIHHSFESTCNIFGVLISGSTLCFNDSLKHLMRNIALFRPGMALMVPLFLETMYKRIWEEARKEGLDKHLIYGIFISNLLRKIGIDKRRLFFKPILDKFGGELRQIVCGGAPLRTELIKKYDEIGINIINGYGITECAPVISTNASTWKKLGTVGKLLPGCEVRIVEPDSEGNGEIQVKSDIIMLGYYKDEESTKEVMTEDGFFATGDLGHLDKDNFLYITGRKKNLIILPNGKNICPEELEEVIGTIPYVKEVMVYANVDNSVEKKDIISSDVFIDEKYLEDNKILDVKTALDMDIRKINNTLPAYKRINDVNIVDHEFEKTTTKKIKRHVEMKRRKNNDKLCAQENS